MCTDNCIFAYNTHKSKWQLASMSNFLTGNTGQCICIPWKTVSSFKSRPLPLHVDWASVSFKVYLQFIH